MSKKSSNKKPGRQDSPPPIPDRRGMEKMMQDLHRLLEDQDFESDDEINEFMNNLVASGKPIPSSTSHTPLDRAQDVMYDAWETQSRSQRVKLAKKALSISEDCADAYVLLAEESARTPEEALELYEQGVQAGERALGPEVFEEDVGHFWGILETRPYMRARAGLAQALWLLGERQKALEHYQDMLRLNPGDNQGLRYVLLDLLIEMGDDSAAEKLMQEYKDEYSANWKYSSALLAFRKGGANQRAARNLKKAIEYNPHVPLYLLGRKKMPRQMPAYVSPGDETEALDYAASAQLAWQQTDGALTWLRGIFEADAQSAG